MKIISFNINGLISAWEKGLWGYIQKTDADIFCVQETRTTDFRSTLRGYDDYLCPSNRPGYAGVGIFTRIPPLNIYKGLGVTTRLEEGRAITFEGESFYLVNVYAPVTGGDLERIKEKVSWMNDLRAYVRYLRQLKPVIVCGDLNIAAFPYELPIPVKNEISAGSAGSERAALYKLMNEGYWDAWGTLNRGVHDATWSPYFVSAVGRQTAGWRLDYFLVQQSLLPKVLNCENLPFTDMSDHRPISLEIEG